jgi:hypothetical protein
MSSQQADRPLMLLHSQRVKGIHCSQTGADNTGMHLGLDLGNPISTPWHTHQRRRTSRLDARWPLRVGIPGRQHESFCPVLRAIIAGN